MPTYVSLVSFTGHGMKSITDSPSRADAFAAAAEQVGVKVQGLYWTTGEYDGVVVLDAPDEETASILLLKLRRQGNVKTKTMRAFDRSEFESLLSRSE